MEPPPSWALEDAAEGAFLGALIGDASGATLEFRESAPEELVHQALGMRGGGVFKTAPGQVTDDGELSLSLAWGLAEGQGRLDLEAIAASYHSWVESKPFDIGQTTRKALCVTPVRGASLADTMKAAAKQHCLNSQSNGGLMRAVPMAIWAHKLFVSDLVTAVRSELAFTHPHLVVQDAQICYCLAICHLLRRPGDRHGAYQAAVDWATRAPAEKDVQDWLGLAAQGVKVPYTPQMGFVKISFVHAFRHLLAGSTYWEALKETLQGGGDTDTNACIVGGMIGAAVGASQIPIEMRTIVLRCNINAGGQPNRPVRLQTTHSFARLFVALLRLAPETLQVGLPPVAAVNRTSLILKPRSPRAVGSAQNTIVRPASPPRATTRSGEQPRAGTSPVLSRPSGDVSPRAHAASSPARTGGQQPPGLGASPAPGCSRAADGAPPRPARPPPPPFVWPYLPLTSFNLAQPAPSLAHILIGTRGSSPYILDFGLRDGKLDLYRLVTHVFTVSNSGNSAISLTAEIPAEQGLNIELSPMSETLVPGQSAVLQASLVAFKPRPIYALFKLNLESHNSQRTRLDSVLFTTYICAVDWNKSECEIEWNTISQGTVLASGAAGCVRKTTLNDEVVAVKAFTNVEGDSREVVSDFYREVQVLSHFKHPNIIRFIGACTKFPNLAIVMAFAPFGSLGDVLLDTNKHQLSWPLRLKLASDIAKGCHYLHCNQVFHRDLKSPNILIMSLDPSDAVVSAVVTDFNTSKFGGRRQRQEAVMSGGLANNVGTTAWSAPEVLGGDPGDDKADVFSFAIILWELVARNLPYSHIKFSHQISDYVVRGGRMAIPPGCLPRLAELIHHCWAQEPDERPAFSSILADLSRISARLVEKGAPSAPPPYIPPRAGQEEPTKTETLLWVDDKEAERGMMFNTLVPEKKKSILFRPFNSTAEMAQWLTSHQDELALKGGDRALRIITNRFREKDGGPQAADKLLLWLRNPAESPFPKTLALVYCSDTKAVAHLRDPCTLVTSQPRFAQQFAGFERIVDPQ